jgi:hypothetical protein
VCFGWRSMDCSSGWGLSRNPRSPAERCRLHRQTPLPRTPSPPPHSTRPETCRQLLFPSHPVRRCHPLPLRRGHRLQLALHPRPASHRSQPPHLGANRRSLFRRSTARHRSFRRGPCCSPRWNCRPPWSRQRRLGRLSVPSRRWVTRRRGHFRPRRDPPVATPRCCSQRGQRLEPAQQRKLAMHAREGGSIGGGSETWASVDALVSSDT